MKNNKRGKNNYRKSQENLLEAMFSTIYHYFGKVTDLFNKVTDPRENSKIEYPLSCIGFTGILMFLFKLGARRQIKYMLKENSFSEENFNTTFHVGEVPHGDTLNDTFSVSNPDDYQEVICTMFGKLIRKKFYIHHDY